MSNIQFSNTALEAIRFAQETASQMGHSYVGSEHLLLGISMQGQTIAQKSLLQVGIGEHLLRQEIAQLVGLGVPVPALQQGLSPRCSKAISRGAEESKSRGKLLVEPEHLLLGLLADVQNTAVKILQQQGVHCTSLGQQVKSQLAGFQSLQKNSPLQSNMPQNTQHNSQNNSQHNSQHNWQQKPKNTTVTGHTTGREMETKQLNLCGRDLTAMAQDGILDPVIGREEELDRLVQILSRRSKNNPILIGEAGVGKTAVVEGLATAIATGEAPSHLMDKRICALDLAAMVAGTMYRGEFEEKLRNILGEVQKAGNIILFIDEVHSIVGAGSAEGAIDAANILKPSLSRGEIQIIGATTLDEYSKYIERDAALERRFQPITVKEPSRDCTIAIVMGVLERYETHHKICISQEAVIAAVDLSWRYLPQRHFPDKAIDLIDEAASQARLQPQDVPQHIQELAFRVHQAEVRLQQAVKEQEFDRITMLRHVVQDFSAELEREKQQLHTEQSQIPVLQVEPSHIQAVLSQWTGIPVTDPTVQDKEALRRLECSLQESLLGQGEAVSEIAQAIRRGRLGLKDPNRPVGAFLLLGPSGVGKTQLCRSLARTLFGTKEALLRFDMSEYMEAHSVSRLIGSPPGYVGHGEGGQLTTAVKRNPWSVVLLDELEKAHADIWAILLQVMEEGVLTDAQGKQVDFRNTVLIMTSNLGSRRFAQKTSLGFAPDKEQSRKLLEQEVLSDAKNTFSPEFLNRLDSLLVFHPLEEDTLHSIVRQLLGQTQARLDCHKITLDVAESAIAFLAKQGQDKNYGARPLRRAIATLVENPVADLLLQDDAPQGAVLQVFAENDGLQLSMV